MKLKAEVEFLNLVKEMHFKLGSDSIFYNVLMHLLLKTVVVETID